MKTTTTTSSLIIILTLLLTAASYVSAHGFLRTVTINGQAYTGNVPSAVDSPSIIRQVSTTSPVKGTSNPGLTCGANSTAAALVANANPGDSLTFSWKGGGLNNWPHVTGPMLTYMANCGSVTCDKYDITNAKWFKIQQIGQKPNSAVWAQADLTTGGVATASLPKTLAAGNYLLRHEIIALQLAVTVGGAEFYPACAQIKVGGDQTGAPTSNELVSLPGAYHDDDPGIYDPNVYNPGSTYTFPGPPIASFVGGTTTSSGGTSSSAGNSNATTMTTTTTTTNATSSSPPARTSQALSATTSKSCRVTERPTTTTSSDASVRPRHFSRIMRRFAFGGRHR